jgi:hypothetical protein
MYFNIFKYISKEREKGERERDTLQHSKRGYFRENAIVTVG